MADDFDYEAMMGAEKRHKERFTALTRTLAERYGRDAVLPMGAGDLPPLPCTYPDAPCRFPAERITSMEAYGLLVSQVCESCGAVYYHGPRIQPHPVRVCFHRARERLPPPGQFLSEHPREALVHGAQRVVAVAPLRVRSPRLIGLEHVLRSHSALVHPPPENIHLPPHGTDALATELHHHLARLRQRHPHFQEGEAVVPERRDDVLLVAHGDAQRLSQAVQVALDVFQFQFLQGIADHIPVVHIPPVPVDAAHVLHVMVDGAGVVKGDDLR